jgi:hypothetical protein
MGEVSPPYLSLAMLNTLLDFFTADTLFEICGINDKIQDSLRADQSARMRMEFATAKFVLPTR